MKSSTIPRTLLALCLAFGVHSQPAQAGGPKLRDMPDFRQGIPKEIDNKWCTILGSTGAFGWIHADLSCRSSDDVLQILVTDIVEGLKSDDTTLQYFAIMSFAAPDGLPNRLRGPAVKERATPYLLQMVVDCDPERETATKLQFALSNALFFDNRNKTALCSGKEGIASADRKVLIPAIRAILATENGKARATVSNELPLLSEEDRELLSTDIYQSGKVRAPSGVMFGDDSRFAAVRMMVASGYEEAIELGMALMREDRRWGRQKRVMQVIPILEPYGAALKPHMPEIREYFQTYAEWCRKNNRD